MTRLVEITEEKLKCAKAVQEKVEEQGLELIEAMEESDQALQKSKEILHEIRASLEKEMASIKRQQRALSKAEISEEELEEREIQLEELRHLQKVYDNFESIESSLDFLIGKISEVLDNGQFEQLDFVQTNLALVTQATEYLDKTDPDLFDEEHETVQSVVKRIDEFLESEGMKGELTSKLLGESTPRYTQFGSVGFWAPVPRHEVPDSKARFVLPNPADNGTAVMLGR